VGPFTANLGSRLGIHSQNRSVLDSTIILNLPEADTAVHRNGDVSSTVTKGAVVFGGSVDHAWARTAQ
jgi:hypothetical protein